MRLSDNRPLKIIYICAGASQHGRGGGSGKRGDEADARMLIEHVLKRLSEF